MAINMDDYQQVQTEFVGMMQANKVSLPNPKSVGAARCIALNHMVREGVITREEALAKMAEFRREFGLE